jgi:hypothetical protein
VGPNRELCKQWQQRFSEMTNVSIINGIFEDLEEFDCKVSVAKIFDASLIN